ncbi:MBL fold metallo-hydrolase [Pseudoramibacter faecis]|uniref:MBL fold metallo-hydrolase n=1 Tax=Pseudoramibacter faecis TaxID=3108534 RepID=UPI002E7A3294|nr:MBL fold metallo-hydrolase [Pseudoramibacter sp. HA2172]
MQCTFLGTGNAMATRCYNTCFALRDGDKTLLVDGGGGSGILAQLERAGIDMADIHDIVVTHKHIDHLLGVIWMVRCIARQMGRGAYPGEARIHAHDEGITLISVLCRSLLDPGETRFLGGRIHLIPVADGETREILGRPFTFFDIHSVKAKQFGFVMADAKDRRLVCCGDEPCRPPAEKYARGADWLLHEAFCLEAEAERFRPAEKHHSTVKNACELAAALGVRHLVLYHTEDSDLARRKARYAAEGKCYYAGDLHVPDDLETLSL